jgi:predicted MFS family arabinose efflux permease
MFAIGTDLFIVSGLLPAVGRDLGLSVGVAGQSVTAFALTYAVASPVLTSVSAGVDRRRLLVVVLGVFAVGNGLSALASSLVVLLASRAVAGAGAALFAATASGVAARISPPGRRGQALAVVYAGMTSAIAIGVPLGNAIGALSSWRWAFAFVAVLAVLAAAGLRWRLPTLSGTVGVSVRERLRAIRLPGAPAALVVTMLWVVGTFVLYTYLGSVLQAQTHASPTARTWLLLAFGVGSFAGVFVGGRLADHDHPTIALGTTIALLAPVMAGLWLALGSVISAGVGLAVWGLVHWASFPLIQHRLLGMGGSHGDMLLALNNSFVYLGQTLAAILGGLLANIGQLRSLPLVGAAIQILAAGVLIASVIMLRPRPKCNAT